jgi:DNA-directed RNA polymerase subunit M/transcription elongation factor TFIIS
MSDSSDDEKNISSDEEENIREIGVRALTTVTKSDKNVKVLEKHIHEQATFFSEQDDCQDDYDSKYKSILYQIIGDIIEKKPISTILGNIKDGKVCDLHPCFDIVREKTEEQDDFISNPFEICEGALECSTCKCKLILTRQKQTRGMDEPMTTFCKCSKCKKRWVYSG